MPKHEFAGAAVDGDRDLQEFVQVSEETFLGATSRIGHLKSSCKELERQSEKALSE